VRFFIHDNNVSPWLLPSGKWRFEGIKSPLYEGWLDMKLSSERLDMFLHRSLNSVKGYECDERIFLVNLFSIWALDSEVSAKSSSSSFFWRGPSPDLSFCEVTQK